MNVWTDKSARRNQDTPRKRRGAAFTFVEILAAMLFMAIVIPVTMQGLRVASDAGTLAVRKATATQLAETMLNELAVTDEWRSGTQAGSFQSPYQDFKWEISNEPWLETGILQLSIKVTFPLRNREFDIYFSTLVPEQAGEEVAAAL